MCADMITFTDDEIMALYAFLKSKEDELDIKLLPLLSRMERQLYQQLSIDELENLFVSIDKKI